MPPLQPLESKVVALSGGQGAITQKRFRAWALWGSIGIIIVSKGRLDFSVRSYNTKAWASGRHVQHAAYGLLAAKDSYRYNPTQIRSLLKILQDVS